jgi:hypothetical protein
MGIERSFNPSAPGFGDAYSVKLTWSFTYTVNGDTWTTDVANGTVVSGILTAGPNAGLKFTIAGFPTVMSATELFLPGCKYCGTADELRNQR